MRFIADSPATLASIIPADSGWERTSVDVLPYPESRVWRCLSREDIIYRAKCSDTRTSDFCARVFAVAHAPASQFDALHELLGSELQLPDPVACLALEGRNFRGHRGHAWEAAAGNLHLCVGLCPPDLKARFGLALTMLPAVAVVDAVLELSRNRLIPGIKWVNDILVEGRKVAGVLTSSHVLEDKITAAVFGVGLNLASAPRVQPTPFVPTVGCLGEGVSLAEGLMSLLKHLGIRYNNLLTRGRDDLFEAYRAASLVIGREVWIWDHSVDDRQPGELLPPPYARGIVSDIAPDLSLRLAGMETPVTKGRVAFAEHCSSFDF